MELPDHTIAVMLLYACFQLAAALILAELGPGNRQLRLLLAVILGSNALTTFIHAAFVGQPDFPFFVATGILNGLPAALDILGMGVLVGIAGAFAGGRRGRAITWTALAFFGAWASLFMVTATMLDPAGRPPDAWHVPVLGPLLRIAYQAAAVMDMFWTVAGVVIVYLASVGTRNATASWVALALLPRALFWSTAMYSHVAHAWGPAVVFHPPLTGDLRVTAIQWVRTYTIVPSLAAALVLLLGRTTRGGPPRWLTGSLLLSGPLLYLLYGAIDANATVWLNAEIAVAVVYANMPTLAILRPAVLLWALRRERLVNAIWWSTAGAAAAYLATVALSILYGGDAVALRLVGMCAGIGVVGALIGRQPAWRRLATGEVARVVPAGTRIGEHLQITRLLGAGSAGFTYAAADRRTGASLAVKILLGPDGWEATRREAEAAARVGHDRLVSVHAAIPIEGGGALIMQRMRQGSLQQRLLDGPLTRREFSVLAADVVEGLAAVHAAGLVHGDVKPANILLHDGRAKLGDYSEMGVACEGRTTGTILYMAPEVARGQPASAAADVFSLGATLAEARTGQPHRTAGAEAAWQTLERAAAEGTTRRDGGRLGPHPTDPIEMWLSRALDPDPARRYPDATSMAEALAPLLSSLRPLRPPVPQTARIPGTG